MVDQEFSSNKITRGVNEPLIELRGVNKKYESLAGNVMALNDINLRVGSGEFLVVTGKSGAGKTTLVNMITGLDRLTSGEIWVSRTPVHKLSPEKASRWRGKNVGVVFQSFELLPTLTVLQNVTLPMDFAHLGSNKERRELGMQLLAKVEIVDHAYKLPSAISGGQQQRVAIARAMANDPPILVADEPTGSLDSATASAVLDIFESLVEDGRTLVLVTHDRDIVERGSRSVTIVDGEIV